MRTARMLDREQIATRVLEALKANPHVRVSGEPLWAVLADDGALTLEGEVIDIASKRRAAAHAARVHGGRVVDRMRVVPADPMHDAQIRDHARDALLGEPSFDECSILVWYDGRHNGREEVARDAGERGRGAIRVAIAEGVSSLEGHVPSLSHKRLVEVLLWWVPGTRDVRNALAVTPPEQDDDDELNDAVRLVLEKEPFIDAGQLRVRTCGGEVTLRGALTSDEQRRIAERDAWFVPGVREVVGRIELVGA